MPLPVVDGAIYLRYHGRIDHEVGLVAFNPPTRPAAFTAHTAIGCPADPVSLLAGASCPELNGQRQGVVCRRLARVAVIAPIEPKSDMTCPP